MPELPEVETVRRGLETHLAGRRIDHVWVGRERTVRRTSAAALVAGLTGAVVESVGRRGKYLVCPLDTGDSMMVHLRMTGQLLVTTAAEPRAPHTHVVAGLDDGAELRFVDPRTFGEVVVFDPANVSIEVPELARLGIDPVADGLEIGQLRDVLHRRSRGLKALLLDQHVVAGLGNIYADEVLHRAGLHPLRSSTTVGPAELRRLHTSIHDVLRAAIEAGGSTLPDAQYVSVTGEGGAFQDDHRVYGRTGLPCATCGRSHVTRLVVAGRSTHVCVRCQPLAPARIRRGDRVARGPIR